MPAKPESAVVNGCLLVLRSLGIFCWRNNAGAFVLGEGASRRFFRAGLVGGADILGVIPPDGRLLALEVKTKTGRLSPAQHDFLEAVKAAGGLALVCRDPNTLERMLRLEGV